MGRRGVASRPRWGCHTGGYLQAHSGSDDRGLSIFMLGATAARGAFNFFRWSLDKGAAEASRLGYVPGYLVQARWVPHFKDAASFPPLTARIADCACTSRRCHARLFGTAPAYCRDRPARRSARAGTISSPAWDAAAPRPKPRTQPSRPTRSRRQQDQVSVFVSFVAALRLVGPLSTFAPLFGGPVCEWLKRRTTKAG